MFISKVFSLFFVCLLSVCGNSVPQPDNANQPQQKEKAELTLSMKRSGCYGQCPIYDVSVQPDGKVLFDGKFYTNITGKAEDKISEGQLKQLVAEIEGTEFFSLQNAYTNESDNCPSSATDMATVIVSIKLNGKEKTITHYLGCQTNEEFTEKQSNAKKSSNIRTEHFEDFTKRIFPQKLYKLENKIDEIVETKRWIGERK